MSNFWGCFFHVFRCKKKLFKISLEKCSIHTNKLHEMKVGKPNFFLGLVVNFELANQLCIALLKIPPSATFI